MVCTEPKPGLHHLFRVRPYDLAATLDSGQAFRWTQNGGSWTGVVNGRWVRLCSCADGIAAETAVPVSDWIWLGHYLQVHVDLTRVLNTLPPHPQLASALTRHRGLRLLRQDPWECLASFILSSTICGNPICARCAWASGRPICCEPRRRLLPDRWTWKD